MTGSLGGIAAPPYRLRDLTGRERWVAVALVLVMLAPFALSVTRAIQSGWYPLGDDALISLRAHEASHADFPLVGQPSTSHLYTENRIAHPGPIEFYWLAIPQRVLGQAVGSILAMATLYGSAIVVTAWIVFRRAGPMPAAVGCLALAGVLSASGGALLIDPLSSNAGGLPLLALFAGAAALAQGDVRLFPVTVAYGSWVAQQHLAIVLPAVVLVAIAIGGVTVALARAPGRAQRFSALRWAGAGVALGLLLWLPVIVDQFFESGNLTAMLGYSGEGGAKVTAAVAAGVALRAVAAPTLLVRTELEQSGLVGAATVWLAVGAAATIAVLIAAVTWAGERSRGARVWLGVTLALAVAGFFNTMNVPDSLEQYRINFYRWAPVVGFGLVVVAGWVGTEAAGRFVRSRRLAWLTPLRLTGAAAIGVVMVGAVGAALLRPGLDDRFREQESFGVLAEARDTLVRDAAVEGAADAARVTLVESGVGSVLVVSPMLDLALTAEGHEVRSVFLTTNFGERSTLTIGDPGRIYAVETSAERKARPGRLLGRWDVDEDIDELRSELLAQYRANPTFEVAPEGRARLVDEYEAAFADAIIDNLPEAGSGGATGVALVENRSFLAAVVTGYYSTTPFDPATVARYEAAITKRRLVGERYLTIREIGEAEYERLIDWPMVLPESSD